MSKGDIITHVCPVCAKGFHVKPSDVNRRKCCSRACSGKRQTETRSGLKSPSWKGGQFKGSDGYVNIFCPDHPYAHMGGYVKRSRLVVESVLHRYLRPEEKVHHVNLIKDDDRPENLRVMSNSEHATLHQNSMPDSLRETLRIKARISSTGRVQSAETREKHRVALLGKKKSPEHIANMTKARWGKQCQR
jgi:hypothetical protein